MKELKLGPDGILPIVNFRATINILTMCSGNDWYYILTKLSNEPIYAFTNFLDFGGWHRPAWTQCEKKTPQEVCQFMLTNENVACYGPKIFQFTSMKEFSDWLCVKEHMYHGSY